MANRHDTLRCSIVLACVAATPSVAADWAFDPRVSVTAEYNDNNRMDQPGDEIAVSGGVLDAQLLIRARTPTTTFRLTPRLTSSAYPGDETEETDNQFLRLRLDWAGQRANARLDADYSRVETLGDYFPTAEVRDDDQLGDPETGVGGTQAGSRNREDKFRVAPGLSFEINERQSLDLSVEYLDVGYDREEEGDRESYSNLAADVAYRWATTQTATVSLFAGLGSYEQDGADGTDSYSTGVEWANGWSETAEVYVRGGAYFVESAVPGESGYDSGFSGGAGVRWKFEVTDIFLDANQYADPNSSGELVERTQLRFELSREVTPTATLRLGLRGIDDSGVAGREGYPGRKYVTADVGGRWRMTRELTLTGGYVYRWKDSDDTPDNAESNEVRLGVVWEPNRL